MGEKILVVALGAMLLFTGCLGSGEDDMDTPADTPSAGDERPPLPEAITDEQQASGSADPANLVTGQPCQSPTAQCWEYPFELQPRASVDAVLTWTMEQHDFDLYLYRGDEQVALSAEGAPQTQEAISQSLQPGSYRLVVVAWSVAQDTFTLEATFQYA